MLARFALSLTITEIAFLVKAAILNFCYKILKFCKYWLFETYNPWWSQILVRFALSLTVTEIALLVKAAILNFFCQI